MGRIPFWIFIIVACVYFASVKIDTIDIDASQYADISYNMSKSGDLIHVFDNGHDYLDKPPFLFWVSALSIKLFGVNNVGYKLPSILFALWALFATYKLAKLLYEEETARMSALVLATCQGMFLMTNDIRCDTILMSWVITSVWLIQLWLQNRKWQTFFFACVAIAFGLMTKGPIALMSPIFCFIADWSLKRKWTNFINPIYILGLLLIACLLLPMSIGLYQQFDMHPEKKISGLRFFYWSQSFGRITGESPWKNDVDISFLLQNMIWSYLPWIFIFLIAISFNLTTLIKQRFKLKENQEFITTGGFILTYFALGTSKYQLPHYIFVTFPLASIATAAFINRLRTDKKMELLNKILTYSHLILIALIFIALFIVMKYVFPAPIFSTSLLFICFAFWLYFIFRYNISGKLLSGAAIGMIILNIFVTGHFYKPLLHYQAGSVIGRYITKNKIPVDSVIIYKMKEPTVAIHFYARHNIPYTDTITEISNKNFILTSENGLNDLNKNNYHYSILMYRKSFKVSELTLEFLNPKTRDNETKKYYFVKLHQ